MSAIRPKKSTAIDAKFFDDFLRREWPLRNNMLSHILIGSLTFRACDMGRVRLNQLYSGVVLQVLHDPLRHKHERAHDANRQQDQKQATRSVHPEVAELVRFFACDAANYHNGEYDPDRGGDEIVISQPRHLGEIAHRAFTAISLPIRVRRE